MYSELESNRKKARTKPHKIEFKKIQTTAEFTENLVRNLRGLCKGLRCLQEVERFQKILAQNWWFNLFTEFAYRTDFFKLFWLKRQRSPRILRHTVFTKWFAFQWNWKSKFPNEVWRFGNCFTTRTQRLTRASANVCSTVAFVNTTVRKLCTQVEHIRAHKSCSQLLCSVRLRSSVCQYSIDRVCKQCERNACYWLYFEDPKI